MHFWGILLSLSLSAGASELELSYNILKPTSHGVDSHSSKSPELQGQVNTAMKLIMSTKTGLSICRDILNGDVDTIEHHLGVDHGTAREIADRCTAAQSSPWISPSPPGHVDKLSVGGSGKRTYLFVVNGDSIPFDSWTEPFSNTTVFVIHSKRDKPINRQRLIQLLAHETAVYFDSKAVLGHWDALMLPELRDQKYSSNTGNLNPRVAVMNPVISHTLTFIRALQVERSIVQELVHRGQMHWPEEYKEPLIANLLSGQCQHTCLEKVVRDMSEIYLPLSLPLVALAPTYRSLKLPEVRKWMSSDQKLWSMIYASLDNYPREYIEKMDGLKQRPFMELIQFFAEPKANISYQCTEKAFRNYLWLEDWQTARSTRITGPHEMTLLEFMKIPLLSGYNILLSNGPRVRIRAGDSL